ncbi:hypothetical protein ACIF80_14885, partial [Streptomyces sp. NPDC085927]|uniref:hypothetical protein n=1 Tax=Streptomyces sp. NPDC085927 TaxID=3365738 RepID=UPI0037D94CAD
MRTQRARRLATASAAGLLMAGGVAVGTAGTASATPQDSSHSRYCDNYSWWNNDCDDYGRGGNGDHYDRYDNGRGGNGDHNDHYDRYDN